MADKAMELAEKLTPPQRRFAEWYIQHGDSMEAMLLAYPEAQKLTRGRQNQRLGSLLTHPHVRAYIEAIRGFGALSIGLSYAAVLLQLWEEATDDKNAGYVRAQALAALAGEMRQSGIAAIEGFAVPDKKALKGDRGSAAVPKEAADQWLELLSSSPPVPKLGGKAG
jgi:tRNA nucleotidyltransferase/poly(A) polymerase